LSAWVSSTVEISGSAITPSSLPTWSPSERVNAQPGGIEKQHSHTRHAAHIRGAAHTHTRKYTHTHARKRTCTLTKPTHTHTEPTHMHTCTHARTHTRMLPRCPAAPLPRCPAAPLPHCTAVSYHRTHQGQFSSGARCEEGHHHRRPPRPVCTPNRHERGPRHSADRHSAP
jgi:hypothetical protein